jgi:hydrogenase/urease accessory protein HupE
LAVHRPTQDLAERAEETGQGSPEPAKAARELAIFDALLSGLAQGDEFPDDEVVREYVIGLAKATDEANEYEQAALEHRALAELVGVLTAPSESAGLR